MQKLNYLLRKMKSLHERDVKIHIFHQYSATHYFI